MGTFDDVQEFLFTYVTPFLFPKGQHSFIKKKTPLCRVDRIAMLDNKITLKTNSFIMSQAFMLQNNACNVITGQDFTMRFCHLMCEIQVAFASQCNGICHYFYFLPLKSLAHLH